MVFVPRLPTKSSVTAAIAAVGGGGGNPAPASTQLFPAFGSLGFKGEDNQVDRIVIPANGSKDIYLTGPSRGSQVIQTVYQNALFPEPGLIVAGPGQASRLHAGISRAFIPSVSNAQFDGSLTDAQKAAIRERYAVFDFSLRVFQLVADQQDGTGPVIGLGDLLVTVTRSFFDTTPATKFILVDRQPISATGSDEIVVHGVQMTSPGSPAANRDLNAYLSVRLDNTTDADISISAGYENYMAGMRSGITVRAYPSN